MAKKEDILAVIVPDSRETDKEIYDISLDFIFETEDFKVESINSESEFNDFVQNIDNLNVDIQNNVLYHIDKIKEYLKQYKKKGIRTLNIDRFTSADCYVFYSLLALNNMITIINSSYANLIFIPKYMNRTQKKSIKLLEKYYDESDVFFMSKVESMHKIETVEGISYSEVLKNLNINVNQRGK